MRLGSDRGDVFAASMLIASARPGEAGLVTTSARIRAEKKCTYGNQARSFSLSSGAIAKYRRLQTATVECSTECSGHLALVTDNEQLC